MTSKDRAALKTQAMKLDSIFQIGKSSLTPAQIEAIRAALDARELIKISVLKNCMDDPVELAHVIAERTGSQVVQVIGKKIVLYKKNAAKEEKRRRVAKLQKDGSRRDSGKSGKTAGGRRGSGKSGKTAGGIRGRKNENPANVRGARTGGRRSQAKRNG